MLNKLIKKGVPAIAASACFATLTVQVASAETVLKYSNWLPLAHQINAEVMLPFAEELERRTEGRVRLEATPKVVGSVAEQFDVIADGLADVSVMVPGYSPGRFTLTGFVDLPFMSGESEAASYAMYDTYMEHMLPLGEFDGVKVLSMFQTGAAHMFNTQRPIETVDDFKGLKLRVANEINGQTAELLGAIPLQKPGSEIYEVVSTGVADGAFLTLEAMSTFKVEEFAKYETLFPGGLYSAGLFVIMNEDKFNSLSPEDQAVIEELTGRKMAGQLGQAYDVGNARGLERLKELGTQIDTASPELVAAIEDLVEPIRSDWIARATDMGLENAQTVLDGYLQSVQDNTTE